MSGPQYQEVSKTIEVPRNAGVEGFILALRGILKLPRVMKVEIDARGKIDFKRWVKPEEPAMSIDVDFDSVAPWAMVRNGQIFEIDIEEIQDNAAICIAALFRKAATEQMFPIAFLGGAKSFFHVWHETTTGISMPDDQIYGLPFLRDRHIPDEALLLATTYGRDAALIDTQITYKVVVPPPPRKPLRVVESAEPVEVRVEEVKESP